MDGGNKPKYIIGDICKLFECCRKIAEFPTITGQLFINGIMLRQTQVLARTERRLQPIFHKRKLLYAFAEAEAKVMKDIEEQTDKLTIVKALLAKTKKDHYGAKTNRTQVTPFHTPSQMESGADLTQP